jgi:hypothetical protein
MKLFLPLLAILVLSFSCKKEEHLKAPCTTFATVRDLSSKAGCGFVFELVDGTKIVATEEVHHNKHNKNHNGGGCHNGPTNSPPSFSLADGQKVKIGYEVLNSTPNACGAIAAEIKCLELDTTVKKD